MVIVLLVLPFYLLALATCAALVMQSLMTMWQATLGVVTLTFLMMLVPKPGMKWRRKPGDPR